MKSALLRAAACAFATAWVLLLSVPTCSRADAVARGESYVNFAASGRNWSDAEKSPITTEDDSLCWAATAANLLDYTGWGFVAGMSGADEMFAYFVGHWTNVGGLMEYAWDWWFDGTNDSEGWSGWSQVDVPGGGFYPWCTFRDYYHEQWDTSLALSAVSEFLNVGWGVGLALYGPGGHAITCWGYSYDPFSPDTYYGLWVTDSDDDMSVTDPPDRLRYYDVAYSETTNRWYLQDFYGSNSWYIGGVEALEVIPEPASVIALAAGFLGIILRRRKAP